MTPEVFITGIGIVSPAGVGTEATWKGLRAGGRYVRELAGGGHDRDLAGGRHPGGLPPLGRAELARSASDGLERLRPSTPRLRSGLVHLTRGSERDGVLAAPISDFTPPRGTENLDRVCQLAVAAAEEAVRDAKLCSHPSLENAMVSVGTSKGGILSFADVAPLLTKNRQSRQGGSTPDSTRLRDALFSIPPDSPARCIAERFNITAGVHATVAACSTGTLAVIRAVQMIQDGAADVVLCGSSDASLHPLWFAAFERMGVLAPEHPASGPAWACRPFDRTRAGFALGEGAGTLVLESGQAARRRQARPIARIAGVASGTDPAGLAQVTPDAGPLAHVIRLACERAGCRPADLACVHAHGTATPANDAAESRAIRTAMGERADSVPVVSIKGAIGHLLGGAGAVEIAAAALTCRDGVSPGNATLIEPDLGLGELNLPREAFRPARGPVLKTSLGFGGHVAAVVLTPV